MSNFSNYLRLMRISLLPTAWSNVLMGYLLAMGRPPENWIPLILLLVCSSCLYLAGMVFNDVCDYELDKVERPERVLPSGKISLRNAQILGYTLFAVAIVAGCVASTWSTSRSGGWETIEAPTLYIICTLIALIVSYNRFAKRTKAGPIVMGLCRTFNVMLGASASGSLFGTPMEEGRWFVAGAIGLYIAGITIFARDEHQSSSRRNLLFGSVCMALGIAALFWFPFSHWFNHLYFHFENSLPAPSPFLYCGLLAMMIFPVVRKVATAIVSKTPGDVKSAVIGSLITIIMIDASICYLVSPKVPAYALGVACLIIPAYLMSRRIMAT